MSAQRGVSIATVLQAYRVLEGRRIIGARPQSGAALLVVMREVGGITGEMRWPDGGRMSGWQQRMSAVLIVLILGLILLTRRRRG